MAHTSSALKRNRQSIRRHASNQAAKSLIKTRQRKFLAALAGADAAARQTAMKAYFSVLDKAVKHGALKKNTAVRKKGRASAALRAATAAATA